jgi:predicted Na+-dependent transporter
MFSYFLGFLFLVKKKEMSPSIYLVMMMVFITPTANNVMVMVELSQGDDLLGVKEILSKLIGWQYLFSPLFLSFHVALLVKLVHGWQ